MVEYGLLVALLSATAMYAAARFGVVNGEMFTLIANAMSGKA
jgi:Flp pilus assembly pilin Flp